MKLLLWLDRLFSTGRERIKVYYTRDPQREPTLPHDYATGPFVDEIDGPPPADVITYAFGFWSPDLCITVERQAALMQELLSSHPPTSWQSYSLEHLRVLLDSHLAGHKVKNIQRILHQLLETTVLSMHMPDDPSYDEVLLAYQAKVPPSGDQVAWDERHQSLLAM